MLNWLIGNSYTLAAIVAGLLVAHFWSPPLWVLIIAAVCCAPLVFFRLLAQAAP